MFKIKVTYKGKRYDHLADALEQAIINRIEGRLKPFENEVRSHGGQVEINVQKDLKGVDIHFKNMPRELIDRIKKSFQRS